MSEWRPTGRYRHRSQRRWGGGEMLVLQIEEHGLTTYWMGGQVESEWVNRWRDARTSDLPLPTPPEETAP